MGIEVSFYLREMFQVYRRGLKKEEAEYIERDELKPEGFNDGSNVRNKSEKLRFVLALFFVLNPLLAEALFNSAY